MFTIYHLLYIIYYILFQTCIFVQRTCIAIFSRIGLVDQSKPCTQIYSQNNVNCINLQLPIVIWKKSILLDMHHHKSTCLSIFSKIECVDQSKPCTQIYLQKSQVAYICNYKEYFLKL